MFEVDIVTLRIIHADGASRLAPCSPDWLLSCCLFFEASDIYMLRTCKLLASAAASLTVLSISSWAAAAERPSVTAGRKVAERNCAACHAIGDGESPLKEAPPFARLKYRYGPGGLAQLLEEGMIKNWPRPLEEGAAPIHPRMPALELGEDETNALVDYLRSLERPDAVQRRNAPK